MSILGCGYFARMNTVFIVLPFCLCLSLRPHSHCEECERGDNRGAWELGECGDESWCPILQATGDHATVIHQKGAVSGTGRLLGQHCASCFLGETCRGALPVGGGESTSSDETILAARYA